MNNPITQPNEILINHFKGTVDLHRVASSIKKLFNAASQHTGRDCYTIADLGRKLLPDVGKLSSTIAEKMKNVTTNPGGGVSTSTSK